MVEENGKSNTTETTFMVEAESGVIINAAQMQSIDIGKRFTRVKTEGGWRIRMSEAARITINFMTSMRKFETTLMPDDIIERDGDDLIILRNQPAEVYRPQLGKSPLAQPSERSLVSKPPDDRTV